MLPVCGFLALDKPSGLSSNQALQQVKRAYGSRRGGYLGTLDPLATGLLPIALGEATKFLPHLLASPKTYRVQARIGIRTATGDREGEVVEQAPIPDWTLEQVIQSTHGRVGESLQIPPMYSALKQGGRPLYAFARKGIEVERSPRRIMVDRVLVLEWTPPFLTLELDCGPGVYVRTWIEDWARSQDTVASVEQLRRLRVGRFEASDMVGLEMLTSSSAPTGTERFPWELVPLAAGLGHLKGVTLDAEAAQRIQQGQTVPWPPESEAGRIRLHGVDGGFLGVGEQMASGGLRAVRLVAGARIL